MTADMVSACSDEECLPTSVIRSADRCYARLQLDVNTAAEGGSRCLQRLQLYLYQVSRGGRQRATNTSCS